MKLINSTLLLIALLLSSCVTATPVPTAIAARPATNTPEATAMPSPTEAPPATATPSPTEAPKAALVIDVTKPAAEWNLSSLPETQRTAIEHVIADPWSATESEKQTFDEFLTGQYRLMLNEAGIPNAETLAGYPLYEAIIQYAKDNGIQEVGLMPFDLHLKVRTDKDNRIVYGPAKDMDPLTKFGSLGIAVIRPYMGVAGEEAIPFQIEKETLEKVHDVG